jgi:ribosomal protein S18 acetylase RimI-like enzyme
LVYRNGCKGSEWLFMGEMKFRNEIKETDILDIKSLLMSSGFFYNFEIANGLDLAIDTYNGGTDVTGVRFLFIEDEGKVIGYSCYGQAECSVSSWIIYWIVIDDTYRGKGIGTMLLKETEKNISYSPAGDIVWIETSSRVLYEPTRMFYEKKGYIEVARLRDFYQKYDDKVVYRKEIRRE